MTLNVPGENCKNSIAQKVLFIGNSYTYTNNLPDLVKNLACDAGFNIEVTSVAHDNSRFAYHATDRVTLDTINSKPWDVVILQNHSLVASEKPEDLITSSLPYAISLANTIHTNNATSRIVYYVTQGRKNGDTQHCQDHPEVCTFSGHNQAIIDGYMIYQQWTGGDLAMAGSAWKLVVDDINQPLDLGDLWSADASHPSLAGSYLTACVLFSTLLNQSSVGLSAPLQISDASSQYLQMAAASATGL